MGRIEHESIWHALGSPHPVGRAPECALRLDNPRVSRLHAEFRWIGESWEIHDLGSRNGTFVNDKQIECGSRLRLRKGFRIGFGNTQAPWVLADDSRPSPRAVAVAGCAVTELKDGIIAVPNLENPSGAIYLTASGWILESGDCSLPIHNGQLFFAGDRQWRFQCEQVDCTISVPANVFVRSTLALSFRVSPNEEHVELRIGSGGTWTSLGTRTCFYLALTLARQRIKDRQAGFAEHGWISIEKLLTMLPAYGDAVRLNVDVFRLRQHVGKHGFDAGGIIERRRGELRLAVEAIEIDVSHD